MRQTVSIYKDWIFRKDTAVIPDQLPDGDTVDLPHTWNVVDGTDGGNDYFRGPCVYTKVIRKKDLPETDDYYLKIDGANSSADVYLNGKLIKNHKGGYSSWYAELGDMPEEVLLSILVDNTIREDIYPQTADFTFYGGLYRPVEILCLDKTHFSLGPDGSSGIQVRTHVKGSGASVEIIVQTEGLEEGDEVLYHIYDQDGNVILESRKPSFLIEDVHLWNGRKDPYLYTAEALLIRNGEVLDRISSRFGCRSFRVDPERGFFLNGTSCPLYGVSRHQDFEGIGNALLPEHHERDIDLILEAGFNAVRLAHYQHDRYFYDLCDEKGLIVWAEIPCISRHSSKAEENALSQMRELIHQCFNHPSICFWGISNEITMVKSGEPDLYEQQEKLDQLVHELDDSRLSVIACFSPCPVDDKLVHLTDVISYNHYFGWYSGKMSDYGPWFDRFHKKYPNRCIGISEYGCEALDYHSPEPRRGDYSEEYQALYHEQVFPQLCSRPYLFSTFLWNMFDFGANARQEGGEHGKNHKGLVTMDRQYKKDAFYFYKAHLSEEPFIHICSKRYRRRHEEKTLIKVYSSLPDVDVYVNGKKIEGRKAQEHVFLYEIDNTGESRIEAFAGECHDECLIQRVSEKEPSYLLKDASMILNWNDIASKEGCLDLLCPFSSLLKSPKGLLFLIRLLLDVGRKKLKGEKIPASQRDTGIISFSLDMSILSYISLFQRLGIPFTKEEILLYNRKLNTVKDASHT